MNQGSVSPLFTAIGVVLVLAFLHMYGRGGAEVVVERGLGFVVLVVGAGLMLKPLFNPDPDDVEDEFDRSA